MKQDQSEPANSAGKEPAAESAPNPLVTAPMPKKDRKKLFLFILTGLVVGLVLAAFVTYFLFSRIAKAPDTANSQQASQQVGEVEGLQLDPDKNYGDKYKDGILPVGDEKFVTEAAQKGSVYLCNANFVPDAQAGAQTRGPWFVGTDKWDINKKYSVQGKVNWQESMTITVDGGKRIIASNNLPDHETGTFPVAQSDPAYGYDRNPNSIKSQSYTYTLTASPTYGSPRCMGGEVGVMLTGPALYNAFDAGGRDAGAWEIQDGCEGHPQSAGAYHYHTLSSCAKDIGVNTVIGFALDGFPITGGKVGESNYLTTDDLDECHGIVSDISLDGKTVKMYHYVMTQDFPYSASCFRAEAATSPGQHAGGQQSGQQGGGPGPQGSMSPSPPPQ